MAMPLHRLLIFCLILLTGSAFAQAPTAGLLAHYRFSGNLQDASGSGNDATGIDVGYQADGRGNAFSAGYFNGRNSLVTGPTRFSRNSITLSAMVLPRGLQGATVFYLGSTAASGYGIRFAQPGSTSLGSYMVILKGGVHETTNADSNFFVPDQWQHIVMVKDTNTIYIYRNGRLVHSTYQAHNETNSPVYFGSEPDNIHNWDRSLNGLMDDARVYGRALSATEVLALYAADTVGISRRAQGVISGRLYLDLNANCSRDGGDLGMGGKTVLVQPGDLAVPADDSGRFSVAVDTGVSYTLTPLAEQYLIINANCPATIAVAHADTTRLEIGIQGQACHLHNVQYVTWARRRCFSTTGSITVSNEGLAPAPATQLHVQYPDGIFTQAFTPAPVSSNLTGPGQSFVFDVPALPARGRFVVNLVDSTACRDSLLNRLLCVSAYADKQAGRCVQTSAGWDGSELSLSQGCGRTSNEIRILVRNLGQPMADSTDYRILSENGLQASGKLKLVSGDSAVVFVVDTVGYGYMFEADQRPGYPGDAIASLYAHICFVPAPPPGRDLRLSYGTDSHDSYSDELCLPATDSWDPNEVVVSPAGVGDRHLVRPGTRLEYRIYFQNKGSAPTRFVTLQDTLPAELNPATLLRGTESHPGAQMRLYNYNEKIVLQYSWPSLVLTPAAISETRSQGFVSFSIAPHDNLALGTGVDDRAGIYFDYNPVVLTNTASITYDVLPVAPGPQPVVVVTGSRTRVGDRVSFYPNPTTGRLMVRLPQGIRNAGVTVSDLTGKAVLRQTLAESSSLDLSSLQPGVYFVILRSATGMQTERITKQ